MLKLKNVKLEGEERGVNQMQLICHTDVSSQTREWTRGGIKISVAFLTFFAKKKKKKIQGELSHFFMLHSLREKGTRARPLRLCTPSSSRP